MDAKTYFVIQVLVMVAGFTKIEGFYLLCPLTCEEAGSACAFVSSDSGGHLEPKCVSNEQERSQDTETDGESTGNILGELQETLSQSSNPVEDGKDILFNDDDDAPSSLSGGLFSKFTGASGIPLGRLEKPVIDPGNILFDSSGYLIFRIPIPFTNRFIPTSKDTDASNSKVLDESDAAGDKADTS